jgi:hypothetical protein
MDDAAIPIQDISPVTGNGLVNGQGIMGVMGRSDEIDCRATGVQVDVGQRSQAGKQRLFDGAPSAIPHMQDPGHRMPPLARVSQRTRSVPVKVDITWLQEQTIYERRALLGEQTSRRGQTQTGSSSQNVLGEQSGRIIFTASDNAALRITRVRLLGNRGARNDQNLPLAVLGQSQGCGSSRNPTAYDQDVSLNRHRIRPGAA